MKSSMIKGTLFIAAFTLVAIGGYTAGARGNHPEIHHAMNKLNAAKDDLNHAAHDYGGHRAQALQYVDQALGELNQALQYADSNKK